MQHRACSSEAEKLERCYSTIYDMWEYLPIA